MADSQTKNIGQVIAESFAKALAQYQISRQEKLDAEADIGHKQLLIQQDVQERRAREQERQARLAEIDLQMKKLRMEMTFTPEQKVRIAEFAARQEQEDQLALEAKKHEYALAEIAARGAQKESGGIDDKWLMGQNRLIAAKNADIKKGNAQLEQKTQEANLLQGIMTPGAIPQSAPVIDTLDWLTAPGQVTIPPIDTAKVASPAKPMPATWKGTQEQWLDYLKRKGMIQ